MSITYNIQPNIFCENCKDCGARPVIEQVKGGYMVVCPNDKKHYRTKVGLVNIDDWNLKNRKQQPAVINSLSSKKAS
jgi:hypothetical protein